MYNYFYLLTWQHFLEAVLIFHLMYIVYVPTPPLYVLKRRSWIKLNNFYLKCCCVGLCECANLCMCMCVRATPPPPSLSFKYELFKFSFRHFQRFRTKIAGKNVGVSCQVEQSMIVQPSSCSKLTALCLDRSPATPDKTSNYRGLSNQRSLRPHPDMSISSGRAGVSRSNTLCYNFTCFLWGFVFVFFSFIFFCGGQVTFVNAIFRRGTVLALYICRSLSLYCDIRKSSKRVILCNFRSTVSFRGKNVCLYQSTNSLTFLSYGQVFLLLFIKMWKLINWIG